jgi:hypothetical protein
MTSDMLKWEHDGAVLCNIAQMSINIISIVVFMGCLRASSKKGMKI